MQITVESADRNNICNTPVYLKFFLITEHKELFKNTCEAMKGICSPTTTGFHMVGAVSYTMFPMVVACKRKDGTETILDQQDVDIGKASDAVVQTEHVCEE